MISILKKLQAVNTGVNYAICQPLKAWSHQEVFQEAPYNLGKELLIKVSWESTVVVADSDISDAYMECLKRDCYLQICSDMYSDAISEIRNIQRLIAFKKYELAKKELDDLVHKMIGMDIK